MRNVSNLTDQNEKCPPSDSCCVSPHAAFTPNQCRPVVQIHFFLFFPESVAD